MYRIGVMLLLVPLAAGCGLELLTTTAIQSELQKQQAEQLSNVLDRTEQQTARMGVEQAIEAYRAEHGNYPSSLETLVREGYIAEIPKQADGTPYGYDPATGRLTTGRPTGPQLTDQQKLQQIHAAIVQYWQQQRRYPPSLDALVPQYLDEVPRTASGHAFLYDPNTATVSLPPQAMQQQHHAPQGGHGFTPQQGGSATSGAHGYAGRRMDNITGQHDQRQQQMMNELGF